MNKPKVITERALPYEVQNFLEEYVDLKTLDYSVPIPREQLLKEIKNINGLITSGSAINNELLNHAPNLKVVSTISVGYNHFNTEEMKNFGVIGTHTPYVLDDTVADLVIGLMLSSARRISELDALTKNGRWKKGSDQPLFGVDVHHKKLGIIGMGRIGEAIAKRAKYGFDMEVTYYNRNRKIKVEEKLNIDYKSSMDELLKESDFIALMVPLTEETEKLIGEREFRLMKKSAIFINASRGKTVDEEAMIKALQSGEILAAGLDVYEQEPIDPNNQLLRMSNVVTLPHIGSATNETRHAMAMLAAKNLVAVLTGVGFAYVVKELQDLDAII